MIQLLCLGFWSRPELARADCIGDMCSEPIKKGQPAPYDGQVMTTGLAISLGQQAENCDRRIKIETTRISELGGIELKHSRDLHEIDNKKNEEKQKILEKQIEQQQKKWYESAGFVATVTVVGALAVFFAAGYGIKGAK